MATQSVNKGFPIPENLADTGQWGVLLDQTMAQLDNYLGGVARPDVSTALAGTYTVSAADAQNLMHLIGGAANQAITYLLPQIPGLFVMVNNCGQTVTVKTSAVSGSTVTIATGSGQTIYCDKTNVGLATTAGAFNSLTVGGAVTAGSIAVGGGATFGDALTDATLVNGTLRVLGGTTLAVLTAASATLHSLTVDQNQATFALGIKTTGPSAIASPMTFDLGINGGTGLATANKTVVRLAGIQNFTGQSGWNYGGSGGGVYNGPITANLVCTASIIALQYFASSDIRLKSDIEAIPLADAYKYMLEVDQYYYRMGGVWRAGNMAQHQLKAGLRRNIVQEIPHPGLEETADGPADFSLTLPAGDNASYAHVVIRDLIKRIAELEARLTEVEEAL